VWFRFAVGDDFDNIESERDIGVIQHSKPNKRPSGNLSYLKRLNKFKRPAQIFVGSRLHFDKHQRFSVAAYHIDFAAMPMFEIAIENFVAASP
jgi:hypothetical protein